MINRTAIILTLMGAMVLPSCAGMGTPKALKPNYIINANGPLTAGFSNPTVNSQIKDFATTYSISRCLSSPVPSLDNFVLETHLVDGAEIKRTQSLVTCDSSDITVDETGAAALMSKRGFDFMDSVCEAYFRRLGNQDQDLDFYTKTLNTVSAALTAILGVTQADAKSIAIVSSLFALSEAGLEGFDESYHFADDLNAVELLVFRAMDAYKDALWTSATPEDFSDAISAVQGYQRICQTSSIRALVNEAIIAAEISAVPRTRRDRVIKTSPSSETLNTLFSTVGVPAMSQATLDWLVFGANGGATTAADQTKLFALLTQAGIADPTAALATTRTWVDALAANEYPAFEKLNSRVKLLKADGLPPVAAAGPDVSGDADRSEIIDSAPITPTTITDKSNRQIVPYVVQANPN